MKCSNILLLAFLLVSVQANADEPFGLKGDQLGSTLADFQKRHAADPACIADVPVWHPIGTSGVSWGFAQCDTTIAGQTGTVMYRFLSEAGNHAQARLWTMSATLKPDSFEDVKAAYRAAFGRPSLEEDIPEEVARWSNDASDILLVRNMFGFSVRYEHKGLADRHEKAKRHEAKDLAKDL